MVVQTLSARERDGLFALGLRPSDGAGVVVTSRRPDVDVGLYRNDIIIGRCGAHGVEAASTIMAQLRRLSAGSSWCFIVLRGGSFFPVRGRG